MRQMGLGKVILLASLSRLKTRGAESVQLVTINSNTPAIKLYHSTGFMPIPTSEPASYKKQISAT